MVRNRTRRSRGPGDGSRRDAGFTLTEVLVALIVTVIAVLGLAHTFGIGRGLIDRYASARDALGVAQSRLETLRMQAQAGKGLADLTVGDHGPLPVTLDDRIAGIESWRVEALADPRYPSGSGQDYLQVTVTVTWKQSGIDDHVDLDTVFLAP